MTPATPLRIASVGGHTGHLNDYQTAAARTINDTNYSPELLAVFTLGLSGESGEVAELVKKHLGHGHPLDRDRVVKELGDVLWYVAALATLLRVPLAEVAEQNIEKLRARYPDGFDHGRSQNRKEGDL